MVNTIIKKGNYKLSYTVKYNLTHSGTVTPFTFKVKVDAVTFKNPIKVEDLFRQRARHQLKALFKGYDGIKYSYKLTKVSKPKLIHVLSTQMHDVNVDFELHQEMFRDKNKDKTWVGPTFEEKDLHIHIQAAKVTEEHVKQAVLADLRNRSSEYEDWILERITAWKVIGHHAIQAQKKYETIKVPAKGKPINFGWVPDVKFDYTGRCAYDMLAAMKNAPKFFKHPEKVLKRFIELEKAVAAIQHRQPLPLTMDYGVPPYLIQELCVDNDVSHFCLDIEKKTLLKNISINFNYSNLVYIVHDAHFYFITDKKFTTKLSQRRGGKNNVVVGMLRHQIEDAMIEDKAALFKNCKSNVPTCLLDEQEDCAIIYDTVNTLEPLLMELYETQDTLFSHASKNHQIYKIQYKKNVTLWTDPNFALHLTDDEKKPVR